jgi:hypothetical protein
MMKKILVSAALLVLVNLHTRADEGMWLPLLLQQLNETQMKKLGMKMSAEDIYSINKGSLKDAIVSFGGGCSGGVVSDQGLILTNHHCGRGRIQALSTPEKNYLEQGFWAADKSQELPSQGLSVTFIVRIEEVSSAALAGVGNELSERDRQSAIDKNLAAIREKASKESYQDAFVRAFYEGNQYFLFITETYNDVRLVGAPPESIGNYGQDTDNWMWPRHTGDFSVFRIYADKNNKPAAYSPDNVPYRPRYVLPVSMSGIKEGDFSMVYGFPGRTTLYLPAAAVDMQVNVLNPIRTSIRDEILAIMDKAMRADATVKLQYTSKQAGVSNAWKKWIGETQGLKKSGGLAYKNKMEAEFKARVKANPAWNTAYGHILPELDRLYAAMTPKAILRDYYNETTRQIELFRLASFADQALRINDTQGPEASKARANQTINALKNYFGNYQMSIDKQLFETLMDIYFSKIPADLQAPYAKERLSQHGNSVALLTQAIFESSLFPYEDKLLALLEEDWDKALDILRQDPALLLLRAINEAAGDNIMKPVSDLQAQTTPLQRLYMKALREVFPERAFAPDANSTLRVSYGTVKGYQARDAIRYEPMTYLEGVMEKYKPGDYEFDVPARLRELHDQRDYGPYQNADGRMPVCFISTSHTTGGNSGSPVFNAHGQLTGLLFDGAWEGVVSDYYYGEDINRSIIVDSRYILFIIDKLGGAKHLVDEMTLATTAAPQKGSRKKK